MHKNCDKIEVESCLFVEVNMSYLISSSNVMMMSSAMVMGHGYWALERR